ncbi:hypothetical protein V6N13_129125 [Hibiscus sabdariffa]
MKIYSVSTRHYYAFGALVSEELSDKLKGLPGVRWVLPDSYLDVENKDYGGEPFINGQAVPYDPKYHEEWVRNNARANERKRRNDRTRNARPRNYDRSRNRRKEMPPPNQGKHDAAGGNGMPPNNMGGMPPRDSKPVIQFGSESVLYSANLVANLKKKMKVIWAYTENKYVRVIPEIPGPDPTVNHGSIPGKKAHKKNRKRSCLMLCFSNVDIEKEDDKEDFSFLESSNRYCLIMCFSNLEIRSKAKG